jgi:hypothetical protein
MKNRLYYLILILLTSLNSCSISEKEKVKLLEEQVLREHDEVMSQMDKIFQKQRKLQASLQKADTSQINTQFVRKQIADLKNADVAMMDWMHQYKSPMNLAPEKASTYLQDQLVKIERVKKQVAKALANTEKI